MLYRGVGTSDNRAGWKRSEQILAILLVAPVGVYLLWMMAWPIVWAVGASLTNKKIGSGGSFVGLANYLSLLTDVTFLHAIINTFLYTLVTVTSKVVGGTVMALALHQSFRAHSFVRASLILPWAIPTLISVLTWKWLLADAGGVFNFLLVKLGLTQGPVQWFAHPMLAKFSVMLINVWRGTPFIAISVLAALQTIDGQLYQAAAIDGASVRQRFLSVTLPGIFYPLLLATLMTTIWTMNDFGIVWLTTRGGPAGSTELISTYSYQQGFLGFNLARAVTVPLLSAPLLFLLINKVVKMTIKRDD